MSRLYTYYVMSGSNTPNYNDYRYYVDYTVTTESSNNRSRVDSTLKLQAVGSANNYRGTMSSNIRIYGETQYFSTYFGTIPEGITTLGSFTKYINHNSDGTPPSASIRAGRDGSYTLNTTLSLATIPRYATITSFTAVSGGFDKINVSWSADAACDSIEYSINGGSFVGTSGSSFTISGLSPGTQYSVAIKVKRTDSQLYTTSSTLYATTTDQARITSVVNFDDEDTPSISFSNPSGNPIRLRIGINGALKAQRDSITSPYTLVLTSAELIDMRDDIPNSNSTDVEYYIDTRDSTSTLYTDIETKTFSIVNANPTFTTFTYEDTNAVTKAVTSSDMVIIKGYSNAKMTIVEANKAIAIKQSTMTSYKFESSGLTSKTKSYASTGTVEETINGIINSNLSIKAIDSRGNETSKSYSPTIISYEKPVITDLTVSREDNVSEITTMVLEGTYTNWANTYTDVDNTIVTAIYNYSSDNGSSWSGDKAITLDTNASGSFTFEDAIDGDLTGSAGFDSTKTFLVRVVITDRITSTTSTNYTLNSAQPLIWKWKNLLKSILGIGKKPDTSLPPGSLDVAGEIVSGGDVYIGKNLKVGADGVSGQDSTITIGNEVTSGNGDSRIIFKEIGGVGTDYGVVFKYTALENLFQMNSLYNGVETGNILEVSRDSGIFYIKRDLTVIGDIVVDNEITIGEITSTQLSYSNGDTLTWKRIFRVTGVSTSLGPLHFKCSITGDRQSIIGRGGADLRFGARDSEGYGKLFITALAAGMNPEDFRVYKHTVGGNEVWSVYHYVGAYTTYRGSLDILSKSSTSIIDNAAVAEALPTTYTYEYQGVLSDELPVNNSVTLLNSWINYTSNGGYQQAGYKKVGNMVYLHGLVKNGSINTAMFILPTGSRPKLQQIHCCFSNTGVARLDILNNGEVRPVNGGTGWFSISGVSFTTD